MERCRESGESEEETREHVVMRMGRRGAHRGERLSAKVVAGLREESGSGESTMLQGQGGVHQLECGYVNPTVKTARAEDVGRRRNIEEKTFGGGGFFDEIRRRF